MNLLHPVVNLTVAMLVLDHSLRLFRAVAETDPFSSLHRSVPWDGSEQGHSVARKILQCLVRDDGLTAQIGKGSELCAKKIKRTIELWDY